MSRSNAVREWVDTNTGGLEQVPPAERDRSTIADSSYELRNGCVVEEFSDTLPADLLELFK